MLFLILIALLVFIVIGAVSGAGAIGFSPVGLILILLVLFLIFGR